LSEKMKGEVIQQGFKVAFFLLSMAILLTFALSTLIEGIKAQIPGYTESAIVFYFISMISIGATIWTYWQAKKTLGTIY